MIPGISQSLRLRNPRDHGINAAGYRLTAHQGRPLPGSAPRAGPAGRARRTGRPDRSPVPRLARDRRAAALLARCYRPGMDLRRRPRGRVLAGLAAAILVIAAVAAFLAARSRAGPPAVLHPRICVTAETRDNQHVWLDTTFGTLPP